MSGGRWNYMEYRLEEAGDRFFAALHLLARMEHVADWALSGDTCRECAKEQVFAALCAWLDGLYGDAPDGGDTWDVILGHDEGRYSCPEHRERDMAWHAKQKEKRQG